MIKTALAALSTWLAMGTTVQIEGSPCMPSESAFREVQQVERQYSTWSTDSELARLNRSRKLPEGSVLEKELRDVLKISQKWRGAFHPGLGKWVLASGVRSGTAPSLSALRSLGRPTTVIGTSLEKALLDPRWVFEEGGFAKGLALDRIVQKIPAKPKTPCTLQINMGGQTLVLGKEAKVWIASPKNRDEAWVELTVKNVSVATSGQSEKPGHLIDPRTGLPVPHQGSATVIHASGLEADIGSTAIAVLGPESFKIPRDMDWIYLEPHGRATAPRRLRDQFQIRSLKPLHWNWVD